MASFESTIVYKFMTNELGLNGTELLVYSIIFNHSSDGINSFRNSKDYIANFLNKDVKEVSTALAKLEQKELITTDKMVLENVEIKEYRANLEIFKEESIQVPIKPRKRRKPTLEEIRQEIESNGYIVDAKKFYEYYEERRWKSQGKRIGSKIWKDVLGAWNTNQKKFQQERNSRDLDLCFVRGMESNWCNEPDAVQEYEEIVKREIEREKRIKKYKEKQNEQDSN